MIEFSGFKILFNLPESRMVLEFIADYFCKPILEYSGYNIVNTLVYGLILLGIAFGIVFPYFSKRGVHFDQRFLLALLPFIIFGSSFRILEDLKLLERSCNPLELSFYTITPGVYIFIGALTILALLISIWLGKQIRQKPVLIFGGIGALLALAMLFVLAPHIESWRVVGGIVALAGLATLLARFLTGFHVKTKPILQSGLNQLVFFGQLLDGSATFVAIQFYSFSEQHVLSNAIIQVFGPFSFVIVKFVLMLLVLYFTDKEIEDPHLRGFAKVFIAILGFAPGIRDALQIAAGLGG